MSIAATVDGIVREEMALRRVNRTEARRIVAQEAGLSSGTLENFLRGRLKNVHWVEDKFRAFVIRRLEKGIARLEHELALARLTAYRPDDSDIMGAAAALEEAKRLIRRA